MTPAEVKQARARLALSQPGLARLLGVTVHAVRHWEQGNRPINATAAAYLAHLCAERPAPPAEK